jgi:hypothetical protein
MVVLAAVVPVVDRSTPLHLAAAQDNNLHNQATLELMDLEIQAVMH